MRRLLFVALLLLITGSCASLRSSTPPPPVSPGEITLTNAIPPSTSICVELAISYQGQHFACLTVGELRVLLRKMRSL